MVNKHGKLLSASGLLFYLNIKTISLLEFGLLATKAQRAYHTLVFKNGDLLHDKKRISYRCGTKILRLTPFLLTNPYVYMIIRVDLYYIEIISR